MSLTIKTVKGVTTLTWESPTMGAFWKIRQGMTDEEIIEIFTNVVTTMKGVGMDRAAKIFELETELGMVPPLAAQGPTAAGPAARPTSPAASGRAQATATAPTAEPAAQPGKILMMPPTTLDGAPAGGAPANNGVDFSALPSDRVPGHLASDWEMAPPEEMERW